MAKIKEVWNHDTSSWDREEMREEYYGVYGEYPEDDNTLDEFIDHSNNLNLESEEGNVECYELNHPVKYYLVIGDLGLWYGTVQGGKIIRGLWRAIRECFEDYNHIYQKGKRLHVDAIHHDGTNRFQIKELTRRGVEYWQRHEYDMTDRELHQRLFKDSHYSHEVSMFNEIYGW